MQDLCLSKFFELVIYVSVPKGSVEAGTDLQKGTKFARTRRVGSKIVRG